MKVLNSVLFIAVAMIACAQARDITGQVFIVTKGGESIKLGLVQVEAFEAAKVDAAIAIAHEKASKEREALEQFEKPAKEFRAKSEQIDGENGGSSSHVTEQARDLEWKISARLAYVGSGLSYIDALSPLASTKTDADGNFQLTIPDDVSLVLVAHAQRLVGDTYESYDWIVPVAKDARRTDLTNDNTFHSSSGDEIVGREYSAADLSAEARKLVTEVRPKPTPADASKIIYIIASTTGRDSEGHTVPLPRGARLILIQKQGVYLKAEYNGVALEVPSLYTSAR